MQAYTHYLDKEFIIWNPTFGVRDFVMLEKIEGNQAWLDDPYDMVGPFDIEQLIGRGEIHFAACMVMTQQKWQEDCQSLQEASYQKQRKIQQELHEERRRRNRKREQAHRKAEQTNQRACRELLCLPIEGILNATQIKSAYRQVAKLAHPDVGGCQKQFVQITEARDLLLAAY